MKSYRSKFAYVLIALAVLFLCPTQADDKKADKGSLWMAKKLEFAQKILAGLTKGDFDMVKSNAQEMHVIGYLEKWDRAGIPEYRRQVKYFDDANKELIRQAEKMNINGATLAYTQLTLSCVQCHTVVRDTKK
jgi:hypothetical protein